MYIQMLAGNIAVELIPPDENDPDLDFKRQVLWEYLKLSFNSISLLDSLILGNGGKIVKQVFDKLGRRISRRWGTRVRRWWWKLRGKVQDDHEGVNGGVTDCHRHHRGGMEEETSELDDDAIRLLAGSLSYRSNYNCSYRSRSSRFVSTLGKVEETEEDDEEHT